MTPAVAKPTTTLSPALERTLRSQEVAWLPNFAEPGVIMEYLATDFPEPLTTQFYTSLYAQMHNVQPTSEKVYTFPTQSSLSDIVTALQRTLRIANVQHVVTPQTIDARTEAATFRYTPKYDPASKEFKNVFLPLLYGALGTIIHQFRGVETVQH